MCWNPPINSRRRSGNVACVAGRNSPLRGSSLRSPTARSSFGRPGYECSEGSATAGDGVRTVEYWVERFNQDGFAGLVQGERPGRPRKLSTEQLEELEVILRASPRVQGVSANLWDGKTLSHWINQQWGVELSTRQCQRLFRHRIVGKAAELGANLCP
jgi:transposase